MLYREDNQWALCPYKVKYTKNGENLEQYTHDKQWWTDFETTWVNTTVTEFTDLLWTDEEKARLEEIKHIGEGFGDICADYVSAGEFPTDKIHPLKEIQSKKENEKLGQDLSEREIQEIIQGQQLSDLEIRLLMGGL